MKKKLIAVMATCALAMCLAGCGSEESAPAEDAQQPEQAEQTESNGVDEFTIEIGGCTVTEDYEGNPAAVVEYTWTNNAEEAQMFDVAVIAKGFQNGVQLDIATISVDNEQFDMEASWKEIKPGTTQTVYRAYLLEDMSELTIEVEGWISDGPVAEKAFTLE